VTLRAASVGVAVAGALVCLVAAVAAVAAPGAPAAGAARLRPLVRGLDQPLYVTAAPGEPSRLYVVEQPGRILVVESGKVRAEPFLAIGELVACCGEQGLLSVAFHPDYARNRRLYVDYTDTGGNTRVVEYRSDGTRVLPTSARRLLAVDQPYPNHNGGQLQFGPDGRLYVGMGDGGSGGDPGNRGQDVSTMLGKLVAIDVDSGATSLAGIGLRNPWRFSFDRATGDLWIGDVGQSDWEEVDHVVRGGLPRNFGWSVYEGRARFKDEPLDRSLPLTAPVAVYSHAQGCSITGGYVYRGKAIPALRGRYLYGDYCSGLVWSLPATAAPGSGAKPRLEPLKVPQLASFGEDAAGELLTVSLGGTVSRIVP
jgi:glucose/arabinose dehydrogenase